VSTELDCLVAELVMATGFSLSFCWGIDPSTINNFEHLLLVQRGVELSFLIQSSMVLYVFLVYIFSVGSDPRVVGLSCDTLACDDIASLHCIALSVHGVSTCCRAFGML